MSKRKSRVVEAIESHRPERLGDANLKELHEYLFLALLRVQYEMAGRGMEVNEAMLPRCAGIYCTSDGTRKLARGL